MKPFLTEEFEKDLKKIKDRAIQERIKKSIEKILLYPNIGKPLRYVLKGLRSARISPYRIIYEMHKKSFRFFGMPKSGAFCA